MTTANKITLVRILVIPFFIIEVLAYQTTGNEWHRFGSLLCFILAALSDGLDGYVARRYHQQTKLGALLDPLADKLLLLSAVLLLSFSPGAYLGHLPLWLTAIILTRDLLLLLGLARIRLAGRTLSIRPHWSGKTATATQIGAVSWLLLKWPAAGALLCQFLAGLASLFSGWIYWRNYRKEVARLRDGLAISGAAD